MTRINKLIRAVASLAVLMATGLAMGDTTSAAWQLPLAPMPIGVNDTVSVRPDPSAEPPTTLPVASEPLSTVPQSRLARFDSGTESATAQPSTSLEQLFSDQSGSLTSPKSLPSSIKLAVVLGILSLAPAIILMTTCYVRIIVVLTLLRQAFGVQQLPPTQVLTALSLFVTLLVMAPVWQNIKTDAIDPYTRAENPISWEEAWNRGVEPMKEFMLRQIRIAKNEGSVAVFYENLPQETSDPTALPTTLEEVPIRIVLPAFLISELKVAFLLGFQIYLPFLILDLVVSSVTVSMGMVMLPPTMVSFPLKLILFVMVDGWNLVLGMLLQSFG